MSAIGDTDITPFLSSSKFPASQQQIFKLRFWWMFIDTNDANKIKATDGTTVYSHVNDVTQVLISIFNAMGTTAHFLIFVTPNPFSGSTMLGYTLRSWDETKFRRGKFTIHGSGSAITVFEVTNDVANIAGNNRVMAFEANGGQYTSNSLSANAAINSFSVTPSTLTDLVVGCHVIIGSNAIVAGAAKAGEHSRIVSISGSTVVLEKYTRNAYNTADSAFIRRVDYLDGIKIEGIQIAAASDYTNEDNFMRFDFAYGRQLIDVKLKNFDGNFHKALVDNSVVDSVNDRLEFEITPDKGHFVESGPYAISCRGACENVEYLHVKTKGGIRHGFTTTANGETAKNGEPYNIKITGGDSDTTGEASWESHDEGRGITYENLSVVSSRRAGGTDTAAGSEDTDAFGVRCREVRIIKPRVENNAGSGVGIGGNSFDVQVSQGFFKNIFGGFKAINLQVNAHDVSISDTDIIDVDNEAVNLEGTNTVVQLSRLKIKNACRANSNLGAIHISSGCADITLEDIDIDAANGCVPIKIDSGITGTITLSKIRVRNGTKPISLPTGEGIRIKIDWDTCYGLGIPPRKLFRDMPSIQKVGRSEGNNPVFMGSGLLSDLNDPFCLWNAAPTEGLDSGGPYVVFATGTTQQKEGMGTFSSGGFTRRSFNPKLFMQLRTPIITSLRGIFGLGTSSAWEIQTNDAPFANDSGIALQIDSSNANYQIVRNDGDATQNQIDTGIALSTSTIAVLFEIFDSLGGIATINWYLWVPGDDVDPNGDVVAPTASGSLTTELPASTTDLDLNIIIYNTTAADRTLYRRSIVVAQDK